MSQPCQARASEKSRDSTFDEVLYEVFSETANVSEHESVFHLIKAASANEARSADFSASPTETSVPTTAAVENIVETIENRKLTQKGLRNALKPFLP